VPYRYLLFYKPYGVISQFSDRLVIDDKATDRPTLKDYVDVPDVYPVGRLDRDSEGLLLLTDHGTLQHRLIEPKYGHARTYLVQVERVPNPDAIAQLEQGVTIKNYRTKPAQVKLLSQAPDLPPRDPPIRHRLNVPTAWLEITLREGKNRQVRRMTAAVGFPTLRLVRIAIANLTLSDLQPGQWRDLTKAELKKLKQIVRLT
jgi:23S rRNA pseudouridine2457 synthase